MLISREDKQESELFSILKHKNEIETYMCKTCGKEEKTLRKIWEHVPCQEITGSNRKSI